MKSSRPVPDRMGLRAWRGALAVFVAGCALTIFSWSAMVQRERQQLQHLVDVGARRIGSEVRTRLATRMGTLSILAREWQGRLFSTRSGWESDVRVALAQSPGLEAVEWIEPDGRPDWVYPRGATLPALKPEQLRAEHRPLDRAFLVGPFTLASGQAAFRVLAPLVESHRVEGWLSGTFRAPRVFGDVLENVEPSYEVLLRSGQTTLARSSGFDAPPQRTYTRRLDLDPPGVLRLSLYIQPSQAMISAARSNLPLVILAGGLVMSALLAAALVLRGLAVSRARQVEALNRDLEARVATRTAALARSNQHLQRFASFLSHELRRPISAHTIWADLLESRYGAQLGDPFQTYVKEIRTGARRMSELIGAQLEISAVGSSDPDVLPVDLSSVVREVANELKRELEDSRAKLRIQPLPVVRADTRQLRQLFRNLLENAIKYRRPGVALEIEISFQPHSEYGTDALELRFRDNGRGFGSADAQRVFRFSERLEPDAVPGHGLGLALCRSVVSRLGGQMHAEGRPGSGATFHVVLPRSILLDDQARPGHPR